MAPQSPHAIHAIHELVELVNQYKNERYVLSQTDAEKSGNRIKELTQYVEDIELAIAVLKKK